MNFLGTMGTDIGPACKCGSTIYMYDVTAAPKVGATCMGCHEVTTFLALDTSEISKVREEHHAVLPMPTMADIVDALESSDK